jgi:cytochrome c oxidase subunit 3/cytochrome o ubiquinol oxidase subunit 3
MAALIVGESALFTIFVVAYVFYIGKSLSGPTPSRVLETPVVPTICLLSSSFSILLAERCIAKNQVKTFAGWLAMTIILGMIFLVATAMEFSRLIYREGLTISTNLFGTTFYSLVGLHATHVVFGLAMLTIALTFTLLGRVGEEHSERFGVVALYWHFVDAVWVVVFSVVYVIGR